MDSKLKEIVDDWTEDADFLRLAKRIKDLKGKTLALLVIRQVTGISIQNVTDLVFWEYYGGILSEKEFRNHMLINWNSSYLEKNPWESENN